MANFVHITILYSSDTFDDLIGYTDDKKYVAVILSPNKYETRYPSKYNSIYVHPDNIFHIDNPDYNIIPQMRYGSLAIYLYERSLTSVHCKKSIRKIIARYCTYNEASNIQITPTKIVINNNITNFTETCIVQFLGRDIIQRAIQETQQHNIILTKLNSITTLTKNELANDSIFFYIIDYTTQ